MRKESAEATEAERAAQFERVLPSVMSHYREILHQFMVERVCPVLEDLFPFAEVRDVIVCENPAQMPWRSMNVAEFALTFHSGTVWKSTC